jgi:tetratricopeptide (TPR) repeat protein
MFRCSTSLPTLLLSICLFTSLGLSQAKTEAPSPAAKFVPAIAYDYSREAVVYEKLATVYGFNADGTGQKTTTIVARIQSDAAVRQLGVISIPYAAQNEHPEIVYLRVRKKDGSVIQTPAEDAQDMPSQVSRIAPLYSDLKEKQIPVKSLSTGDTLEYQVLFHIEKAQAPNQFWGAENFTTNAVILDQTVELRLPKEKYIQVVSPKAQPVITEEGGKRVYRWKTSHPEPAPIKEDKKSAPKADPDTQPTISWTTFRSWKEVGDWYGGLAKDRAAATPEIKTKAEELIKGKSTDDQKIQAIYDYVSTQVRYIGVDFGIGRYQPHAAETVMDNQYGDCKDKHTLLAALLKAAGYDAWPALISDSTKPIPDLPSPGQFDHVITVIPRGAGSDHAANPEQDLIWLDSTPEISPYRMLIFPLRDKQALVIPDSGPATLMTTPANPPFAAADAFEANSKLDSEGTLTSHMSMSLRGDNEIMYREIFHQTSRTQWNDLARNISLNLGFGGTLDNLDVSIPEHTIEPFHYSYDYTRKEYSDWSNRRILPLTMPVIFPSADDDDKPVDEVNLGSPHVETSHSVIELPANYTAVLPKSVRYATEFASYQADYKLDDKGRLVTDCRVEVIRTKVPISEWDAYKKFVKNMQDDQGQFIQLIGKDAPNEASEKNDPIAEEMLQEAYAAFRQHDYVGSRRAVDRAMKQNPNERGLWTEYGYIDMAENHLDDALSAFQKEVQLHPRYERGYEGLTDIQLRLKHIGDAENTLRQSLKAFPSDKRIELRLGSLLVSHNEYKEAVAVLVAAHNDSPDDNNLAINLGEAQILAGNYSDGEAIFRPALERATNALILNNAAYVLADKGLELDLAEASCHRALHLLDNTTSQMTLQNLNGTDLQQVSLLIHTWDTMGWIYFRKGELALAENYIQAAWAAGQARDVGDHLGQIYEKEGKKQEAANVYALASASGRAQPDSEEPDTLEKRAAALKNQGIRVAYSDPGAELGQQRSAYIPQLTKKYSSAEFFVELSPGKIENVAYIRGDESLKTAEESLRKAELNVPFPKDSQAKLIRRGILVCSEGGQKCQFAMLLPQSTTTN